MRPIQTKNQSKQERAAITLLLAFALFAYGCTSTGMPRQTAVDPPSAKKSLPGESSEKAYAADLKSRLDYIIDHRLSASAAVKVLDVFVLDDYDIQDQNTFWAHRDVAGRDGPHSVYYFTYRNTYFILFLQDIDTLNHKCLDLRIIAKTNSDYELNAGRVEIDGAGIDEEVIVLFNKRWNAEYSTDILAAFKPVIATGKIETVKYAAIRIYREE